MSNPFIYTASGPVAEERVYIRRPADEELFRLCREGHFTYVLTSRQMGKSSLMKVTARALREAGVATATVDLSQIGKCTEEEWYHTIIEIIARKLDLTIQVKDWWNAHGTLSVVWRFSLFFNEVIPAQKSCPVVLFFDEIDYTLKLPFSDDFYAAVRAIHNARSHETEFLEPTFVLIGTATPDELITDKAITPFNIGREVILDDFSLEEAEPLAHGLGLPEPESHQLLRLIFKWSGGHPYLTQKLCILAAREKRDHWDETAMDRLVVRHFIEQKSPRDLNLPNVERRLLGDPLSERNAALNLYAKILRHKKITNKEQSDAQTRLRLAGIVRKRNDRLVVRNLIYQKVFDQHWVLRNLKVDWKERLQKVAVVFIPAIFFVILIGYIFFLNQAIEKSERTNLELEKTNQDLEKTIGERDQALDKLDRANRELAQTNQALERTKQQLEEKNKIAEKATSDALASKENTEEANKKLEKQERIAVLEAEAYKNLSKGQIEEAALAHEASLALQPPLKKVDTLKTIAETFEGIGDYERARNYYDKALEKYRESDNAEDQIEMRNKIGEMFFQLGCYDEAIYELNLALDLAQKPSDGRDANRLLAWIYYRKADYGWAEQHAEILLDFLEAEKDDKDRLLPLMVLGRINLKRGSFEEAKRKLVEALAISEGGNQKTEAEIHNVMGDIERKLGNYEKAHEHHEKALALSKQEDHQAEENASLHHLAQLELGEMPNTPSSHRQGRDKTSQFIYNPRPEKVSRENLLDLLFLGKINLLLGQKEEASRPLNKSLNIQRETGDLADRAETLKGLGRTYSYTKKKDKEKAEKLLLEALKIEEETGSDAEMVRTYEELGKLYAAQGAWDELEDTLTKGYQLAGELKVPFNKVSNLVAFGKFYHKEKSSLALRFYKDAILSHESSFPEFQSEAYRTKLAMMAYDGYSRAIDILVKDDKIKEAFCLAERARFYTLYGELLPLTQRLFEKQKQYKDPRERQNLGSRLTLPSHEDPPREPGLFCVEDIRFRIPANAVVLAYFPTHEHTLGFLIGPDGLKRPIEINKEAILAGYLDPPVSHLPLYEKLIQPFGKYLEDVEHIGFVPFGLLLGLPEHVFDKWGKELDKDSPPVFHIFSSCVEISFPSPAGTNAHDQASSKN